MDADGGLLSQQALTAIHWSHRLGALLAGSYLLLLAALMARRPPLRAFALALAGGVCAQAGLGIANVLAGLPLPLAVAHNAGAALLLLLMVVVNHGLARGVAAPRAEGSRNANAYA